MTQKLVMGGKVADIWSILRLVKELQPHIVVLMDESKPWRERLECGLHVAQILAQNTETGLDDDVLAWLAKGGWDVMILDFLAELLEKQAQGATATPAVLKDQPMGIDITVILAIVKLIWDIIQMLRDKDDDEE